MKAMLFALTLALAAVPAQAQLVDSAQFAPILSAALGAIRDEFAFGVVVVDRVVIDTTKRLAPPLLSRREHKDAELWAKANRAESINTEMAHPTCRSMNADCQPTEVAAAIGLSDPVIAGDSARVFARYARYDGTPAQHLRITVEELTLRQFNGEWKVQHRKVKANG
jgi:hypothetical protein